MLNRLRRLDRTALRHGIVYRVPPPDDDSGDNGGNGGGGGSGQPKEKKPSEVVASLIRRYGDPHTALGVLAGDNLNYRKRHREDKEKLEQVSRYVPKEGERLLTAEEAKAWEAYTALGKPEDVKATVERTQEVESQLAERERRDLLSQASNAVGYKPTVLEDRVRADGLHVELRDTEVDDGKGGKSTVKLPYVRKADKADEPLAPLTEYATKNWADYLPSLTAEAHKGANGSTNPGVTFPVPPRTDKEAGGSNLLESAIQRRRGAAGRGNPLAPAKPAETAGK